MVDKNLFPYDLAVVAILKDEGHYLKEWLDYHLLAGVNHFYLYDNDSTDNQAEVVKPYVKAGLVDYIPLRGEAMQFAAYNDAIKKFKFQCRYMAFIDGDEFIYPKTGQNIAEVVDEILSHDVNASGVAIHWQVFGSNGETTADYSRGVLERFTRRATSDWYLPANTVGNFYAQGNCYVKNIVNPRRVNLIRDPHKVTYFADGYGVDENANLSKGSIPLPIVTDKIVVNHYYVKSREEFTQKVSRGSSARLNMKKKLHWFELNDRNDEFDDGILKYRDERKEVYQPPTSDEGKIFGALMVNLFPPSKDDMETFLTCRAVSPTKFFEEASLVAVLKSLDKMNLAEAQLLIRELPKLLKMPYPVVRELKAELIRRIPQFMYDLHLKGLWREYVELDCILSLLKE